MEQHPTHPLRAPALVDEMEQRIVHLDELDAASIDAPSHAPTTATSGSRLATMVLCEAALLLVLVGVVLLLLHLQ
jgi:hypothetical protein